MLTNLVIPSYVTSRLTLVTYLLCAVHGTGLQLWRDTELNLILTFLAVVSLGTFLPALQQPGLPSSLEGDKGGAHPPLWVSPGGNGEAINAQQDA